VHEGEFHVKILICVAGLPFAESTIKFGNVIASLDVSEITLLTVVDKKDQKSKAKAMLEKAAALVDFPINKIKVRRGRVIKKIVDEANKNGYDMIVVGFPSNNSLTQMLTRSITNRVAEKAEISVLVVKEERPSLKNILICTGGLKINQAVIRKGASLAKAAGASVQLLYVTEPVPGMYSGLEDMDETLPELLQSNTPVAKHLRWAARYLAENNVSGAIKVRHGVVNEEILREAQESRYDLVIVGTRTEVSLISELFMEKVTPHIVEQSPCSVLIVRE
jgi:nucleotide-binding universal stress UspA family protein